MPPNGRHGPGPARGLKRESVPGQQEPLHHVGTPAAVIDAEGVPTGIGSGPGRIAGTGPCDLPTLAGKGSRSRA